MSDSSATLRLLERAETGDSAAFDLLFSRNRDHLRRTIELRLDQRLRRRIDPSDVIQETQIEAFRRLAGFLERRPMPFSLWLEKTAHERIAKLRRSHRRTQGRSIDREVYLPDQTSMSLAKQFCKKSPNPLHEAARKDVHDKVRKALARLPDLDHEVLIMRYLEHRDNQEIAYLLDMNTDAVSRRHGRAILKFAKLLRESGIGESDL